MYFTAFEARGLYWIHIYDGDSHVTFHYEEKELAAWVMAKVALAVAMDYNERL